MNIPNSAPKIIQKFNKYLLCPEEEIWEFFQKCRSKMLKNIKSRKSPLLEKRFYELEKELHANYEKAKT